MSELATQPQLEAPELADYQPAPPAEPPVGLYLGMGGLVCSIFLAGISWAAGGSFALTHMSFLILTLSSAGLFIRELLRFTRDYAMGSMCLFGGVLVWFAHDYIGMWILGEGYGDYETDVVAKATFYHAIFIFCAGLAVRTQGWRWLGDKIGNIREPRSPRAYFPAVVCAQILALLPMILFAAESLPVAFWRSITAGRGDAGPVLTIEGASGNLNYNWSSYFVRLSELGQAGAIFAAYYALFLARSTLQKIICWTFWAYWLARGFGTGTRGMVILITVPTAAFVYFRFESQAAAMLKRVSKRAYVYGLGLLILTFILTQIQITYRNVGYDNINLREVDFSTPQGNLMFSESLEGFRRVPAELPPLWDKGYPGMTLVAPIPIETFFFAIHPIPRPLWNSKPLDPAWHWYNVAVMGEGREGSYEGTTVATGLVGYWYIRYGMLGVLQGGLLFGWLLATVQRAFRISEMRPLSVFYTCGLLMCAFRMFRAFAPADFWALSIGLFLIWLLLQLMSKLTGGVDRSYTPELDPAV